MILLLEWWRWWREGFFYFTFLLVYFEAALFRSVTIIVICYLFCFFPSSFDSSVGSTVVWHVLHCILFDSSITIRRLV